MNKKYIILIHDWVKKYLKNNHYYTLKHSLKQQRQLWKSLKLIEAQSQPNNSRTNRVNIIDKNKLHNMKNVLQVWNEISKTILKRNLIINKSLQKYIT